MGTNSCAQILCPGTSTNWHLEEKCPKIASHLSLPYLCNCVCRIWTAVTYMPMVTISRGECNSYLGVRFPPASSKNGWLAYTKSSKLVFSSPPSCNSSSYRLFVRRNCRNLATILGLSFPPGRPNNPSMSPRKMSRPRPLLLLLGFIQIFQPLETDFLTMQEQKTSWLSRSTLLARSVGELSISWNRPNPSLSEQLSVMMGKCMQESVKAKNSHSDKIISNPLSVSDPL